MQEEQEDEILRLHAQEKWEEIIRNFDKNKFLPWVWPEKKNLEFIGNSVRSQNSNSVISIGCGSGLLEWLLATATGMEVTGIETDGNWWKSKYASGTFIPMILVEDPKKGEFGVETENAVLLFCYFNNLEAFLNYLRNFRGNCFIAQNYTIHVTVLVQTSTGTQKEIREPPPNSLDSPQKRKKYADEPHTPIKLNKVPAVIGPGRGRGTYTIPEPFQLPDGLEDRWQLSDHQEIRSSRDFIAVYVRK